MGSNLRPEEHSTSFYPIPPPRSNFHSDIIHSMTGVSRFRKFTRSHRKHHHHQANIETDSPSPTTPQTESISSQSSLESRDIFHHTTPVKIDSAAGATGTSVAQLPGRHLIVPPWLAIVVWLAILFFVGLTIAGFSLSYQARKEFRMRVEEQRKAQEEAEQQTSECKIPITRKEFKSFTRKSIMVLNSHSPRGHNPQTNSVYSIDKAGELRPRNMFDRPSRDSILVAEITAPGHFSGDDPFYEFSRQMTREGLWDVAARKSKAISVVSLSSMMPKIGRRSSNRFTMMDLAEEELDEQNYHSTPLKENLARPSNTRAIRFLESSEGADLRIEDHMVQPNRFIPPVPKLPVQFVNEQPDSGEKLSTFNDISFLSHKEDEQSSHLDHNSPLRTRIYPPQRTTSRRGRGAEEPTHLERANSQSKSVGVLSPPQRSTSLREKGPRANHEQSGPRDHHDHDDPETADAIVRATTPFGDVSPDDAVAQYASTRAASVSPLPTLKHSKSSSMLGFILRSTTPTPHSLDGRESPAQMGYLESITEPLPMAGRSQEFQDPPLDRHSLSENADDYCKPFSVIFEDEDEDEDYFNPPRPHHTPYMSSNSTFWDNNSSGRSPETENIPLPRRLPQAALARTSSHKSRLRSHTTTSQEPTSVAMTPTSSTPKTPSSSSFGARSRSGSSGVQGSETSPHRSINHFSSSHEPPLTLKRNPSLSTNPYGRRRKQQDDSTLSRQLSGSPRRHTDRQDGPSSQQDDSYQQPSTSTRRHTERQDRSSKRHPPHSRTPRGSTQDPKSPDPSAPVRRAVSAQARIPLSGTMSSGGVRNSSFVP